MTRRLFKSPLFMFYFLALLITYSYQVMKNVCIIKGLSEKGTDAASPPKNTEVVHGAMPSARPWRAQARDHCACAREDPIKKAVRWQKFCVLQAL